MFALRRHFTLARSRDNGRGVFCGQWSNSGRAVRFCGLLVKSVSRLAAIVRLNAPRREPLLLAVRNQSARGRQLLSALPQPSPPPGRNRYARRVAVRRHDRRRISNRRHLVLVSHQPLQPECDTKYSCAGNNSNASGETASRRAAARARRFLSLKDNAAQCAALLDVRICRLIRKSMNLQEIHAFLRLSRLAICDSFLCFVTSPKISLAHHLQLRRWSRPCGCRRLEPGKSRCDYPKPPLRRLKRRSKSKMLPGAASCCN